MEYKKSYRDVLVNNNEERANGDRWHHAKGKVQEKRLLPAQQG